MYFSIKNLKRIIISRNKNIVLHDRSLNVPTSFLRKVRVWISRGLYPTLFTQRLAVNPSKTKFGMFSFTRKPFAIPEKKGRKKRRNYFYFAASRKEFL